MRALVFLAAAAAFAQDSAIVGTVRDALTKAPIAGVAIEATGPEFTRNTTSDANGGFIFEHLATGNYRLKYTMPGYTASEFTGAALVTVGKAGSAERVPLEMIQEARLEGVVVDEEGHPMQDVIVYSGGSQLATTGADGRYAVEHLRPGNFSMLLRTPYEVRRKTLKRDPATGEIFGYANTAYYPGVADPLAAVPVPVSAGMDLRGFDIRLRRVRLVEFNGRIVEGAGGEPLAGARVELLVNNAAAPLQDETYKERTVPEDGSFRFDLIQPGSYSLLVYRSKGAKALPYTLPVEVGKAGIQDMKVGVPPFPSLQGSILAPPDTEWDGQVIFNLRSASPGSGVREFTVNTEKFTIDDLPPGRWMVEVESNILKRPQAGKLFVQSARFGTLNALAEPLVVTESGNPPFEIRLTTESGRIMATVADQNGVPRKGVLVLIMRNGTGPFMPIRLTGRTKDDGSFLMDGLTPGSYRLSVVNIEGRFVSYTDTVKAEVKLGETAVVRITVPTP